MPASGPEGWPAGAPSIPESGGVPEEGACPLLHCSPAQQRPQHVRDGDRQQQGGDDPVHRAGAVAPTGAGARSTSASGRTRLPSRTPATSSAPPTQIHVTSGLTNTVTATPSPSAPASTTY